MQRIVVLPFADWQPEAGAEGCRRMTADLETGRVLALPDLDFSLARAEYRFFDPRWLNGRRKSISFDPMRGKGAARLGGARGTAAEQEALAALLGRYRSHALSLAAALFPAYRQHLRPGGTTFRPAEVEGRRLSWRKDDSLLHVDAFPSRPNGGERILRVFTNVNPAGVPRVWKLGGSFEATAREFAPRVKPPLPGAAALLHWLRLTRTRRGLYDHLMLGLHDAMKRDAGFQARPGHLEMPFPDGASWICFSDQVSHAVLSGQFLLEQTIHVPLGAMQHPERAPLRVLERILGRPLSAPSGGKAYGIFRAEPR